MFVVNENDLASITKKVVKKFPEMKGVQPSVKTHSKGIEGDGGYVITFKGKVEVPGGRSMDRIVRVITDSSGQITKMSTSK